MSYNSNIPLPTDRMLVSVDQIRANYQAINQVFLENHTSINGTGNGQHTSFTFRNQLSDPSTSSSQVCLYMKSVGGVPTLFYRPANNASVIQMSYPSISTGLQSANPDVWLSRQYSFVAGPFIVYSGFLSSVSSGQNFVLSPTSTLLYANVVLSKNANSPISAAYTAIAVVSGSSFTIQYSSLETKPQNFYYFAIGQP